MRRWDSVASVVVRGGAVATILSGPLVALPGCARTPEPAARSDADPAGAEQAAAVAPRPSFPPPGDSDDERAATALRDEAFDVSEELVRLAPDAAAAWSILAAVHRRYGDAAGAARLWERALEVDPRHAVAHRRLGEVAEEAGDVEEAERRFRLALAADPSALDVAGQLADALVRRNELAAATELLEAFVAAHPRVADAWATLGKTRVRRGDTQGAREAFERAIDIDPDSREAHQGLGRLLQSLGDPDAARPHLKAVVRLDDEKARRHRESDVDAADTAAPRVWVATVHAETGLAHARRGDNARAERDWTRALELDPASEDARGLLARLFEGTGRSAEALPLREEACRRDPDDPDAWYALARAGMSLDRRDEAMRALEKLFALVPEHAEGLALSARAVADHDASAALELARRAVALSPTAANEYVLADMLVRNGKRDEAVLALERACTLEPDDSRYRATLRSLRGGGR